MTCPPISGFRADYWISNFEDRFDFSI